MIHPDCICPRQQSPLDGGEEWVSLLDLADDCPVHGLKPCAACGEPVHLNEHYVPALGHLAFPEDAIEPYYVCARRTA